MSDFVQRYAWWLLAAHGLTAAALYTLAAHYPIREPWTVPPSTLDARIPMITGFAWVYATYVLLLPVLVLFARRRPGFARVFVTGMACALTNALVYILFPTSLAERVDAPAGTLLAGIQALDTTLCALPSGHVALPVSLTAAAALQVRGDRAWAGWACVLAVWTVLLAASTLFTRQHYLVDVAAGAAFGMTVALAAAWIPSAQVLERGRRLLPSIRLDEAA